MFQPDSKLLSSGFRSRGGARGQIAEDRDRLLEQSAVLLVERGMDQLGLDFGRYFGAGGGPFRCCAIICSTVWICVSGAATSPPSAAHSMAIARSARAAELTLTMSERALISMLPSTVVPSSIVTFQPKTFSASSLGFGCRVYAGSSSQFQNASFSRCKLEIAVRRSPSSFSVVWGAKGNRTS